ncbi:hypothetical protein [Oleiagrimonas soli]|uniref:Uncharacterized protein n=1 Tax=Oleiagrimonas soli TaxID=1543381 RepID=A0A099CX19_9GAMM|nr:hypothetical protein [Oleiagrimonas soli]KGI78192.1 hypothetical protein LF63_0107595 [Oleiagrimonas soli]MBB6183351.1 hypothetical protein [Oleiagrimonas soli]
MNTSKTIAAAASVAILVSTLAVFRTSANTPVHFTHAAATAGIDNRPVTELAPVVVYASALPDGKVGALNASFDTDTHAEGVLPTLESSALRFGSQLYMPYYSFASNLHTLIKE